MLRAPISWTCSTSALTALISCSRPAIAATLFSRSAGELLDLRQPRFDRRQLLLAERHLRSALLELLEHVFGARQLILGRLNLADRVALPALDAIELDDQFVLDLR